MEEQKGESTEPNPFHVIGFLKKRHDGDVRCLACDGVHLFSGSRDNSLRAWEIELMLREESEEKAIYSFEAWVNALAVSLSGFIAAGLADGVIALLEPLAGAGLREVAGGRFGGHEAPVSSLSWTPNSSILVSGGWDGTARVWDAASRSCSQILPGHENIVCVLALADQGPIATGSTGLSDGTGHQIRLWTGHPLAAVASLTEHRAGVRQLCKLSSSSGGGGGGHSHFASASNDGTVKVWDATAGSALATLESPTGSFVYCVDACSNGSDAGGSSAAAGSSSGGSVLAFGDEDGHVVICGSSNDNAGSSTSWQRQQMLRVGSTVWAVKMHAPTGLVFAGCADGRIVCLSRDPLLPAVSVVPPPPATAAALGNGRVVAGNPPLSELAEHVGRRDGQISVFEGSFTPMAFRWEAAARQWTPLGPVEPPARGVQLEDVVYDAVIPVEVESASRGFLTMRLGFNFDQDPAAVARDFCGRQQLGEEYLPQVEFFLRMNYPTVP